MGDRLDDADAAVVGNVVGERRVELRGAPQALLTVAIEQRVKGDVEDQIVVRTPRQTDCDVTVPPRDEDIGLLLTEAPGGAWLATACSVVDPAELVAAGGEPRGGAIKVVVGLFILGLVLLWAVRRRRRGARPELPGPSRN
jgi:MYXO-CTERM domain-containing protein